MEETTHVLCPVYSHELKLITLITVPQTTLDELDPMSALTVGVLPDPKAIQVNNPKTNQIELTMAKIGIDGDTNTTFFAEDAEKAMRLPCAFAPGQALAVAETYNTGFKAGAKRTITFAGVKH